MAISVRAAAKPSEYVIVGARVYANADPQRHARTCRHFRGSAARLLVPVSMDAHVRTGAPQPIDPPEEQPRTSAALELARRLRRGGRMSHKTVQLVIGWLLTDEDLRGRFMAQPRMTLASLRDQG